MRWFRRSDDTGSIAPLVPIVMFALLLLGGLVVDGSRVLNARGNAEAYAEEAARAGATATKLGASSLALDYTTARERVDAYCRAVMTQVHTGIEVTKCQLADKPFSRTTTPTCDGTNPIVVVHVVVQVRTDTTLMGMAGFTHFTASAAGTARPFEGITAADAC